MFIMFVNFIFFSAVDLSQLFHFRHSTKHAEIKVKDLSTAITEKCNVVFF